MADGRDWNGWYFMLVDTQDIIVKNKRSGKPFPLKKNMPDLDYWKMPKTPIFHIKAWGKDGYK